MEEALRGDIALVKAWKADEAGNLLFRKTARNFNQPMATAGGICVVEGEEIVAAGSFDDDAVHLPGIYVQRLLLNPDPVKQIEFVTTLPREASCRHGHTIWRIEDERAACRASGQRISRDRTRDRKENRSN